MRFPARLMEGYRAFVETRLPVERSRYETLAEAGQRPESMVICCCDSRVAPEVIFDARAGDLFVVRNVANLVPPYTPTGFTHGVSAALEFAVQGLKVKYIVVMGHSQCGGIRAFVENQEQHAGGDFIGKWMALIAPAAAAVGAIGEVERANYVTRLEQASIVATLGNLMTFPWIRNRVVAGDLQLLGAYFDVLTGALSVYDPAEGSFTALDVAQAEP